MTEPELIRFAGLIMIAGGVYNLVALAIMVWRKRGEK